MVTENFHYWEKYDFFGGHPFLDFINTVNDLDKDRNLEGLPDWASVLHWAEKAELISSAEKKTLGTLTGNNSVQAEIMAVHQLRELGFRIFSRIAAGNAPDTVDIHNLSKQIVSAFGISELQFCTNGFYWNTDYQQSQIMLIRTLLALAAHDLLTGKTLNKLAECGGCTGLFLNNGRGVGRKWCRMSTCGNRAKINKYRSTHK